MRRHRANIGVLLLSLGGVGFLKASPATIATFGSAIVFFALSPLLPDDPMIRASLLVMFFAGVFAASLLAIRRCVPRDNRDQPFIVVDEFLGVLTALGPFLATQNISVLFTLVAAGIFRVIDHYKPFGIRHLERSGTPLSVLIDDVAAGIVTACILLALQSGGIFMLSTY